MFITDWVSDLLLVRTLLMWLWWVMIHAEDLLVWGNWWWVWWPWWNISNWYCHKNNLVIKSNEVKFDKGVKRSAGLWCFACGDCTGSHNNGFFFTVATFGEDDTFASWFVKITQLVLLRLEILQWRSSFELGTVKVCRSTDPTPRKHRRDRDRQEMDNYKQDTQNNKYK